MGKDLNKASRDAIPINLTKVYTSLLYSYITVVDVSLLDVVMLSPPAIYLKAAVLKFCLIWCVLLNMVGKLSY
jgi:uncharacterized membrane protein